MGGVSEKTEATYATLREQVYDACREMIDATPPIYPSAIQLMKRIPHRDHHYLLTVRDKLIKEGLIVLPPNNRGTTRKYYPFKRDGTKSTARGLDGRTEAECEELAARIAMVRAEKEAAMAEAQRRRERRGEYEPTRIVPVCRNDRTRV